MKCYFLFIISYNLSHSNNSYFLYLKLLINKVNGVNLDELKNELVEEKRIG